MIDWFDLERNIWYYLYQVKRFICKYSGIAGDRNKMSKRKKVLFVYLEFSKDKIDESNWK